MNVFLKFSLLFFVFLSVQLSSCGQYDPSVGVDTNLADARTIEYMNNLFRSNKLERKQTLEHLENTWTDEYIPILLDIAYFSPEELDVNPIFNLLRKKTGQKYGSDLFAWLNWIWNKDPAIASYQGDWMAQLYNRIDDKFEKYFLNRTSTARIRLDEVRWGGVLQDGIPPLRGPEMISANSADYLDDDNVVFGISINGDHRAYPKRILAWHEMFVDNVGGESIAGVYCTLCGTVIAYNTKHNGVNYNLGTSGFLYRSNKLMYDKATQSLWNTIEGKPVIGPLVDKGIELSSHSVVTTTWGEWKKLHPETTVLSLNTGHRRNYDEGNAYNEYFSTDRLMFNVPKLDQRLLNKDEVLIVRANDYQKDPLAIAAKFLKKNPIYNDKIGDTEFVVLTDKSGGNRVFESNGVRFIKIKGQTVRDSNGKNWQVTEEKLISETGQELNRLPYHRIFWFAWFNTYENTRLVGGKR